MWKTCPPTSSSRPMPLTSNALAMYIHLSLSLSLSLSIFINTYFSMILKLNTYTWFFFFFFWMCVIFQGIMLLMVWVEWVVFFFLVFWEYGYALGNDISFYVIVKIDFFFFFKCVISRKPKYPFLDLIQRWHFGTLIHFWGNRNDKHCWCLMVFHSMEMQFKL